MLYLCRDAVLVSHTWQELMLMMHDVALFSTPIVAADHSKERSRSRTSPYVQ